jgi:hypothetical protein
MNWITPNLAVGSAYHDSDKQMLDAQGISAVLQLYEGVALADVAPADTRWSAHRVRDIARGL